MTEEYTARTTRLFHRRDGVPITASVVTTDPMSDRNTPMTNPTSAYREATAGVIVEDPGGAGLGAAWLRYFIDDDPPYGFVAADIPELSIGVSPASRGQGLGTRLCTRLLAHAHARGIRQVSLSLEKANPARGLYERFGFDTIRDDGDAVTMLRQSPTS